MNRQSPIAFPKEYIHMASEPHPLTDFLVGKEYVRKELRARHPDFTPMELTKLVGSLWGRLVNPSSPFDKFSSRGTKLARVTRQHPERIWLSARNLLAMHATFDTTYQHRVGDIIKGRFDIIVDALQRDLGIDK